MKTMNNMKKLASLLLALVMVLAMAVPAMASGDAEVTATTYTLTLNNAIAGHTYTAYQIFDGDLSGDVLSNIVWGAHVNTEAEGFGTAFPQSAATVAESLKNASDAEAFAAKIALYLKDSTHTGTVAAGGNSCEIAGLDAGYYLVKTTGVTATNDVYTYYIMKVVKDTSANVKADVPEVDKTVNDNDANIGDTVTFTLTATMPTNIQGYDTYKLVFHDTMSAGLTYTNTVTVKVGDTTVQEKETKQVEGEDGTTTSKEVTNYTVVTGNAADTTGDYVGGTTITVTLNDVLSLGATAGSTITVTYTATVDSDAVIGTEGNPNKVYLEYSNNPNWDGTGDEPTGDTPEDEVKVYTWEIPVSKYTMKDGEKSPLAGAGFTLYKGDAAVNVVEKTRQVTSKNDAGEDVTTTVTYYQVCTKTGCTDHAHQTEITTNATGKFEIEGLEKGTYVLKETTTPAGYNTCADITVVVGDNGALTVGDQSATLVEVENKSGSTLPETGGMGTTLIYVAGTLLVAGAVIVMISKKRAASK